MPPSVKKCGNELFYSSEASSIIFVFCGGSSITGNNVLTYPSTIKAYVTSKYPINTKLGGVDPSIISEEACQRFYKICREHSNSTRSRLNIKILTYIAIVLHFEKITRNKKIPKDNNTHTQKKSI